MKKVFIAGFLAGAAAVAACTPVTGDRILGSDLLLAEPGMAGLPSSLVVGFAPAPGEKRVFTGAELVRVARANGVSAVGLNEVCFEFPVRRITPEEIASAMGRVLPAAAHLEILELGKTEAPAGEIDFPVSGMEPADASGTRVWRGAMRYSGTHKFPIWARVKVLEDYTSVVANRDLGIGQTLDANWFRIEKQTGPMPREPLAQRIEDVQGQILKKPLRAGMPLPISWLGMPLSVRRGETVRVEVASGWARLHFEAVAESDGREGESIPLRNPLSGKTFRAKVGGSGKATVVIGGPTL